MEEIIKKRDEINAKLNHLTHVTNNSNHRKIKSKLLRELTVLDKRSQELLTYKLINGNLTVEKFEVTEATKYKDKKGLTLYPTMYAPIENQPAAFIGSESLLKEFDIFPMDMKDEEIRSVLCDEQETNDRLIKAQEEEEDYEDLVIPKIRKN